MPTASPATVVALRTLREAEARLPAARLDWLDDGERQRLSGIADARLRTRFLAGHWLTRETLAQLTRSEPERWRLRAADSGMPLAFDLQARHAAHVSISHSGDFIACAASRAPVGIDVEAPHRERDLVALARRMFPASEAETLAAMDAAAQRTAFYRRWTLDEAHAKRDGDGLASERQQRQFWHEAPETAALARSWRGEDWFLALCVAAPAQLAGTELATHAETAWFRLEQRMRG